MNNTKLHINYNNKKPNYRQFKFNIIKIKIKSIVVSVIIKII